MNAAIKARFQKLRKGHAVQAMLAFAIRMASGVAGYVLFAVIARLSGAEDFGTFSVLFSVIMTAGIVGSFGQQIFFVKEVPSARAEGSLALERGSYLFSTASTFITSALAGVAVAVYTKTTGMATSSFVLAVSGAALATLYGISQMTIGALRVQDLTLYAMASRDLLWRGMAIVSFIALQYLGSQNRGLTAQAALVILSCTLAPIVCLHLFHMLRHFRRHLGDVKSEIRLKKWIDASFGMTLVSVISSSDLYIYTVLLGSMVGKVEAGAFFASLKTVELLNMFLMAVTLVTAPEISKAVAKGDRGEFQRVCNQSLLIQGGPVILAAFIIIAGAPLFLGLFDSAFVPYANMLRLLALGMLINALTGATVLILQLIGRHWQQVLYQGGALVLSVVLLPLNIELFGVYGVAVSFIISKTVWNTLAIYTIRKHKRVDPSILGLFWKKQAPGEAG